MQERKKIPSSTPGYYLRNGSDWGSASAAAAEVAKQVEATAAPELRFSRPFLPPFAELEPELREIFSSGILTKGEHLERFESGIRQLTGAQDAVAVSSCTVGLVLLLSSLPPGSEVVVPSFTFCATVHSIVWNGLFPVFADCDAESFNLDPVLVEEAITANTSAILAVHVFGNPAEVEALQDIANRHNLRLFFDAAHSLGSTYKARPVVTCGDASVISLSPTKLISTGEGGVVITRDKTIGDLIRCGREYGNGSDCDSQFHGLNARMDEFSALLGHKSLQGLREALSRRRRLASQYWQLLEDLPGIRFQQINLAGTSSFNYFAIVIDPSRFGMDRDQLALHLQKRGIPTKRYFFPPVHQQRAYARFRTRFEHKLTQTNYVSQNILALPLHYYLSPRDIEFIARSIWEAHRLARR